MWHRKKMSPRFGAGAKKGGMKRLLSEKKQHLKRQSGVIIMCTYSVIVLSTILN